MNNFAGNKADANDGYLPDAHAVAQPNVGIAANR